MTKVELTGSTRHARGPIVVSAMAALGLLALLAGFLGCSDSGDDPVFPEAPLPETGTWFLDIWGSSANDIYIVGQPALMLHYDGNRWARVRIPRQATLTSIYGESASNIYVCGHDGVVLHYNGSNWSSMSTGTSKDLFGIGRFQGELYVCGQQGAVRRLSGGQWVDTPQTVYSYNTQGTAILDTLQRKKEIGSLAVVSYYGIAGDQGHVLMPSELPSSWTLGLVADEELVTAGWSQPGEIGENFLATEEGRLYQLSLADTVYSWIELSSPATSAIYGMWSADQDTFYYVTRDGQITRRIASSGEITEEYDGPDWLFGIWGAAPDDIYAVGLDSTLIHFDGEIWSPQPIEFRDSALLEADMSEAETTRPLP
jgi:hypothetical protein